MTPKNERRKKILKRAHANGLNVKAAMAEFSPAKCADVLIKCEDALRESCIGGTPAFTGKTRTFGNGAVAYEIRCSVCRLTFWMTCLPHAKCPDCR